MLRFIPLPVSSRIDNVDVIWIIAMQFVGVNPDDWACQSYGKFRSTHQYDATYHIVYEVPGSCVYTDPHRGHRTKIHSSKTRQQALVLETWQAGGKLSCI